MEHRARLADGPSFANRSDAGNELARELAKYRGKDALVLGIPRGGVLVAAQIARALDAELDVAIARKLPAPGSPELAIGAVTANGGRFLDEALVSELGVSPEYLGRVTDEERAEAQHRERHYRGGRALARMKGRTVILVDDGLATGATMKAAVRSVRRREPARVVVAVPVGAADSCADLRREADEVVCPFERTWFGSVGSYYRDFSQTREEEVEEILARSFSGRGPGELMIDE
jgi:putative phosphoribosyl transferase